MEINEKEQRVFEKFCEIYFKDPNLVKFLMIENLALKLYLFDSGFIESSEKLSEFTNKAKHLLESQVKQQMDKWRMDNPKEAVLLSMEEKNDS